MTDVRELEIVKFVHFSLRMNPGNVNATRNLSLKGNLEKYFDIGCFGSRHQIGNQYLMLTCSVFLRSGQFDKEPLILSRRTANNSFLNFQQIFTFTHFPTTQNRISININLLVEGR